MNKINFELIPYSSIRSQLNKQNGLDKNLIAIVKKKIIKIVRFCEAVLMHECDDFEKLSGRDIDTFYISQNKFININNDPSFIFHEREKESFRFLINDKESCDFLNLDVENLSIFSPSTKMLNAINFNESFYCKKTRLKHFKLNAIIYYKLVKYFYHGVVFSYEQLFKLKKILNLIDKKDLDYILNLTSKNLPKEHIWIKKLVDYNFESFEKNKEIKNFWKKKRIIRQNKRKVFAGKLKLKNLFFSKKFFYALIFGSFARWPKNHNPLPAIAIIGNDGAGKTTVCNYVVKNFSKLDPAHINMKSDEPLLSLTRFLTKYIKKILKFSIIKKLTIIKKILAVLGQSINIFDQYIKYRIGMAFADSGFGVTIFERYITDKLRGEFPNINNKLLPLEQFFPFPDGMFYIDVMPHKSISRKIKDKHTISEMTSKRKNYISLLKECDEVKIVSCDNDLKTNIKELKNYIFELALKKKKQLKSGYRIKRCVWKKNKSRILAGDPKYRFQKGNFL